ncbi:hypothetical protein E0L36_23450 [Streptomyces sp. AJS327]|uniref:hypothetical protein n=1 Tax=Streptomyces sp. AJS327 TaxID=2545265 RepID=UPI0015DE26AF|nr:hypothetical protein [Streptomyces sp. AJS327]MBA0053710.1 hypothetical protein [Streptomyces sp. AJS327]
MCKLEQLRGAVDSGFARLDLLTQRDDQTDRTLTDHGNRLDAIERRQWPLASVAALVALAALTLSAWQLAQ